MKRRKMGRYEKLRVRKQSHKTYNFLTDTIEYLVGSTLTRSLSLLGASSNRTDFYNFDQVQSAVEQVEDAVRALPDDADDIKAAHNDLTAAVRKLEPAVGKLRARPDDWSWVSTSSARTRRRLSIIMLLPKLNMRKRGKENKIISLAKLRYNIRARLSTR